MNHISRKIVFSFMLGFMVLVLILGAVAIPSGSAIAAKPPTRTPKPTATSGPTPTPVPPTATPAPGAGLTCSTSTTLETLVTCIIGHFGSFVIPSSTNQTDWRTVVTNMMNGQCDFAPPGTLVGIYTIKSFTDSGNSKTYCVAYETADSNADNKVDKGWGTFIVDNTSTRQLNHTAPHAVDDLTTENQAIYLFKYSNSRSFLMTGATRNIGVSTCQDNLGYAASDASHNIDHFFQVGTEALNTYYGATSWWQIQWHGMASDSCPENAYISHGFSTAPPADSKTVTLKNKILQYHPTWNVTNPGGGTCSLNATTTVEGRYLNGVPRSSCCGTNATTYQYKFIHTEQDPNYRNGSDWLQAVLDTWP